MAEAPIKSGLHYNVADFRTTLEWKSRFWMDSKWPPSRSNGECINNCGMGWEAANTTAIVGAGICAIGVCNTQYLRYFAANVWVGGVWNPSHTSAVEPQQPLSYQSCAYLPPGPAVHCPSLPSSRLATWVWLLSPATVRHNTAMHACGYFHEVWALGL